MTIYPTVIAPLFNKFETLPEVGMGPCTSPPPLTLTPLASDRHRVALQHVRDAARGTPPLLSGLYGLRPPLPPPPVRPMDAPSPPPAFRCPRFMLSAVRTPCRQTPAPLPPTFRAASGRALRLWPAGCTFRCASCSRWTAASAALTATHTCTGAAGWRGGEVRMMMGMFGIGFLRCRGCLRSNLKPYPPPSLPLQVRLWEEQAHCAV